MMSTSLRILTLLALLCACEEKQERGADAGPYDGSPASCVPELVGSPVSLAVDTARGYPVTWVMADGELIAVAPGVRGRGYAVTLLGANGAPRGESRSVLPDVSSDSEIALAAESGVLAIAEVAHETTGNQRPYCRLSLVRLSDQTALQQPLRVSDPTEEASIVHEAQSCLVTGTDSGFVVAWQQYASRETDDSSLFAQRIGLDGALSGERMTLVANTPGKRADLALTSDGARALIAFRGVDQSETTLAIIAPGSLDMRALPGVETPIRTFAAAHGGFLLRTHASVWLLDAQGGVARGPHALDPESFVAPLGDEYVTLDRAEYWVARALDAMLSRSSEPVGVSEDRAARVEAVLAAADGANTRLIVSDSGSLQLVKLGCGSKPGTIGPKACPKVADLQPLDPGCSDDVCHVVLRLDYLTLGVRGWTVRSAPTQPVDASQAERAAKAVFDANSEYLVNPLHVSGPSAGLYYVMHDPSDFGGFALVSQQSGVVVAAGGIVWSGRGSYWLPESWRPAADIQCGDKLAMPRSQVVEGEACADGAATTPNQAMSVALSTNVAQAFAAQGAFTARTYLYTPSVGACAVDVAEWLVVLSRP